MTRDATTVSFSKKGNVPELTEQRINDDTAIPVKTCFQLALFSGKSEKQKEARRVSWRKIDGAFKQSSQWMFRHNWRVHF